MNSLRFAFSYARDEISERLGWYPASARTKWHFLDHRTLAFDCDCNGGDAYVMWGQRHLWKKEIYRKAQSARTMWLRLDSIADFVEEVLPTLSRKIVLVTLESDYSPILWQPKATETLLASEKIAHWFCGQCDIAGHPKVTPVPLGIPYPYRNDLHPPKNLLDFSRYRARTRDVPSFEQTLQSIVAERLAPDARPLRALADFAINNSSGDGRHGETRADIAALMAANPNVDIPGAGVPQLELYRKYGKASFVVSPFGRGPDCYRTWEALLMGAIPIVKRSAIDAVFEGYPVVVLDDWREMTPANLKRWRDDRQASFTPDLLRRLSNDYWMEKINAAAASI